MAVMKTNVPFPKCSFVFMLFLSFLFRNCHATIDETLNGGKESNRSSRDMNIENRAKPSFKRSSITYATCASNCTFLQYLLHSGNFAHLKNKEPKQRRPPWPCKAHNLTFDRVLIMKDRDDLTSWLEEINKTMCCAVVLFYARWCYFSSKLAPFYNAFGRAFNNIPVLALDAYNENSFNNRYGIVGVPTIVLFHEGRPVTRFNKSKTFKDLSEFLHQATGLSYNKSVKVTWEDYEGPLSSTPEEEVNYYLIASTLFLICITLVFLSRLHYVQMIIDRLPSWTTITRVFRRHDREKDE